MTVGTTDLRKLIPGPIRRLVWFVLSKVPAKIEVHWRRASWPGEDDRFSYQSHHVGFDIRPGERVLDVGVGSYPFPQATIVVDRFVEPTKDRYGPLRTDGKPFVLADIHALPFHDKCFDFVYCSHLLEHVDNPIGACKEIIRIGKRGYIETPTFSKDALFAWAKGMHKWHLVSVANVLCFFEYSARQAEGIRSRAWRDIILSRWHHPLQKAFYENQDLFNVMFPWSESFGVFVFHLDGAVEVLDASARHFDLARPLEC